MENSFPRTEWDPSDVCNELPLKFQVTDWVIPEKEAYGKPLNFKKPAAHYEILMFGCTDQGESVCAKVTGFEPSFFVKLPESDWKDRSDAYIKQKVVDLKRTLQTDSYMASYNGKSYTKKIISNYYANHLVYVKIVKRKDFWGFSNFEEMPFVKIKVKSLALFNGLKRYFKTLIPKGYKLYETNIDPFLRFIHERKLDACGWVHLKPNEYDLMQDTNDGNNAGGSDDDNDEIDVPADFSRAKYNIAVPYNKVHPAPSNKIAPLLIASFDIECTSSHGDFPVAKKTYLKLAQDLVQLAKFLPMSMLTADALIGWILQSYKTDVTFADYPNARVHRVYPKSKPNVETLKSILSSPNVVGAIQTILHTCSQEGRTQSEGFDEESDNEETEGTEENEFIMTKAKLDQYERDVLSILNKHLPALKGDSIIQIGTTVHRYGSDEIIYRHIVTLKSCADFEECDIESYETEAEVLLAWKELIQRLDPDVLIGYNIFGFDMEYIWQRLEELGIVDDFALGLGRLNRDRATLVEQKLSSSALGDNLLKYIRIAGVVNIDVFKYIQREQKLDSYKLDYVAGVILGDHKNDLKPKELFQKFLGNADDRADIAKYCVQDCMLVNRLFAKLKVLENNVGMGNVCHVPLSYLFMRGQGIKIFSLVAKECREQSMLIPDLRELNTNVIDDDGYEGAIVLVPQAGIYLDVPISVLDFASLYPTSMIERNLSHDCYVLDDRYRDLPNVEYLTVTYDIYEGTADKKTKVGEKQCTFAQLPNGKKGIIPNILLKLVQQRKNTRKKIEYETVTLTSGKSYTGLVRREAPNVTILDIDTGATTVVSSNEIANIHGTYSPFEQAVLDALQLAYKITANSLYGQIGARTSPIYLKDIAACTTATGRERIIMAKDFVETEYGAEVIYGDSVMPYTPVLLRHAITREIRVFTMDSIPTGTWTPYTNFKKFEDGMSLSNKEQCPAIEWQAWTDRGWSPIRRVIRHNCHKRIFRIVTHTGMVDVTEDHSLMTQDRKIVKPEQLTIGDSLLHAFPNPMDLASFKTNMKIQNQPLDTTTTNAYVAQCYFTLLKSKGYDPYIDENGFIAYSNKTITNTNVKKISVLHDTYDGYVYDIETDEGVFQAGIGGLIVKNTDSIFCKFPNRDPITKEVLSGKEALKASIAAGQRASREISAKGVLPKPQCLEYEKTFFPFIIFSKKRYVGNLYEDDADKKPKQKSMGIVLKRRDNAPIVKLVYGGIIDILLNQQNFDAAVHFFKTMMVKLTRGEIPLDQLIISKTLRGHYKDPLRIAHKVLAERMGERDPGNKPAINDRIPYIYVLPQPNQEIKLQGDRIEHPDYIREKNLTPDYLFYITNQIMKPVCQIFALCVEKIEGYNLPPGYWLEMEEELRNHKTYKDNVKKRDDKMTQLRMKEVQHILFQPFMDLLMPPAPPKPSRAARDPCPRPRPRAKQPIAVMKMKMTSLLQTTPTASPPCTLTIEVKENKETKHYDTRLEFNYPHPEHNQLTSIHTAQSFPKKMKVMDMDRAFLKCIDYMIEHVILDDALRSVCMGHGIEISCDKKYTRLMRTTMNEISTYLEKTKDTIQEVCPDQLKEDQKIFFFFAKMKYFMDIPIIFK